MKLPEFQTGPVQSAEEGLQELRGSMQHLAEETGRAWQMGSHAASALQGFAEEFAVSSSKIQVAEAMSRVRSAQVNLNAEMANKFTYTTDEVNDLFGGEENVPGIVKQASGGLTKTLVDPDTKEAVTMKRSDIPGYVVNPFRFKQVLDKTAQEAADSISLPGWRNEFLRAARDEINEGTARHQEAAQTEQRIYETTKLLALADHSANMGDFKSSRDFLGMVNMPPEQRVKAEEEILRREGKWGMDYPFGKQDFQLIGSTVAGLRSGANEFDATTQDGKTQHVNVTAIPQDDRRRHAQVLEDYGKGIIQQAKHDRDEAQKTFNEKIGKQWLTAFATDNPGVINNTFQQIMKESSGALSESELRKIVDQHHAWLHQADKKGEEGLTPANVFKMNFAGALTAARMPGASGMFTFGGREFDLKDMKPLDIQSLALSAGVKPKEILPLINELGRYQLGKPETNVQRQKTVDAALDRNGWVLDNAEDDTSDKKGIRANNRQAVLDAVDQENAVRKSPMNPKEETDFVNHFLSKSITPAGAVPAPDISGISSSKVREMQQVRGEYLRQKGVEPFANTQEALAKAITETDPYVKAAIKIYPQTAGSMVAKEPFDQHKALRVGLEIKTQAQQLEAQVMQAGKKPTPENLAQQYFLNQGFYGTVGAVK